jgi:hypothetical protein
VIALDRDELQRIVGGCDNGTRVGIPGVSVTRCTSNYAECTKAAADAARQQYPDTRPHVGPVPLPFTTDENQAARAGATVDNTKLMCGVPS